MSKKKKIQPRLRFKDDKGNDFPDWEEKTLGDIATFTKGKGISKSDIAEDGRYECIRYGELYTDYGEVIREVKSKTNLDSKNLVFSKYNDVIIPASGETQIDISTASCVLKDGVALGGDLNIIKSELNGVFLTYYLNNVKKLDIAKLAQGNAVVHLYANQLKTLTIEVPSKDEQIKIADFLSAIDDRINSLVKELEELKAYKKGVMQAIFGFDADAQQSTINNQQSLSLTRYSVSKDGKLNNYEFIRFKDDDGNDYPDWVEKTLGEITTRIGDGIHATPKYDDEGDYYFINGNNLINDKIVFNESTKKVTKEEAQVHKRELGDRTILLSINGTIGNLAFYDGEQIVLGKSACYINVSESVDKHYVYYALSSDTVRNFFLSELTGTTIKNLSLASVKNAKIKLPIVEEQKKISGFLFAIDEKINHSSNQIENTRQYKQALLQQLFN